MAVYERRAELYLVMLERLERTFAVIRDAVLDWVSAHGGDAALRSQMAKVLELDQTFCPRVGQAHQLTASFSFPADRVEHHLGRMELPPESAFSGAPVSLLVHHPAHVGEVLKNPDGGSWMRGQVKQVLSDAAQPAAAF
jgi:hypothetical protein